MVGHESLQSDVAELPDGLYRSDDPDVARIAQLLHRRDSVDLPPDFHRIARSLWVCPIPISHARLSLSYDRLVHGDPPANGRDSHFRHDDQCGTLGHVPPRPSRPTRVGPPEDPPIPAKR